MLPDPATGTFVPATDLASVLARMDRIEAELPAEDGVAYFNRMYREVTRLVRDAVAEGRFASAEFLERLDVNFANLFFTAYAAEGLGAGMPPAWEPLFQARARTDVHPIQFALAGMNAHISHDLAFAVVQTCTDLGLTPDEDGPEHADFTRTNDVLRAAEPQIKRWFATGVVARLDEAGGRLDDGLAMFAIDVAREAAWETAQMLWRLRDNPRTDRLFRRGLARTVELTSRGILL